MARKTNLQLQQELAEVKAALAAAEAAKSADQTEAEDRTAKADAQAVALHEATLDAHADVFGGVEAPENQWITDTVTTDAPPAWAQALLDRIDALETRKPRKAKTPVGEREGDVTIRNITSRLVRVRLGKASDPYRIELQPRGRSGDVADVPGSLVGTTQFKRNVGRVFEIISSDDAAGIDYSGTTTRQFPMADLVREAERIVARQKFDPNTGLPIEQMRQTDRSLGGPVGPRIAAAPGSDNVLMGIPEGVTPEVAEFLAWKASRGTLGAPMNAGPAPGAYEPGAQTGVSLLTRLEQAARSGDQEAGAMARKLRASAEKGVIPEGELEKPLRVTRNQVSVQPNVIY